MGILCITNINGFGVKLARKGKHSAHATFPRQHHMVVISELTGPRISYIYYPY